MRNDATRWLTTITVSAVVAAFLTMPQSASACSCADVISPDTAFENATAVFSGRAISLEVSVGQGLIASSTDPVTVEFLVDTVWKGPKLDHIAITTVSSVSCGYEFRIGRWYLVYAEGSEDDLQVYLCSGTKFLALADDDIDILENGDKDTQHVVPSDEENDGLNYVALIVLISVVIISTGIGVAVAKRHHAFKR